MMWFLLLIPMLAWSESDIDLSGIQDLDELLPDNDIQKDAFRNIEFENKNRNFRPPVQQTSLEEIMASGLSNSFIKDGSIIYRLSDNKPFRVNKDFYLKTFRMEDELGFRYLRNNDGTCKYKTNSSTVNPIDKDVALYEPPTKFSPAPANIIKTEYDKKLLMVPEAAVYVGIVKSNFVRDLFNDPKARSGITNQFAFHYFTEWALPVKAGASVHYEKNTYQISDGGSVIYDSLSFGPQFRSKDFEFFETAWRLTTQIRVSPFARLRGETSTAGGFVFKFNSTDFMNTLEHPWKNNWGQFVLGSFHQIQWLNFKDQPGGVSVRASNQTNQSFGLFLSQVFQ